jgi:putative sigma-54 modulation protein
MNIELRVSNAGIAELLKRYIERRLQFALGRFGERVSNVLVRLHASGRGSESKCRITVELRPMGRVAVEVRDPDLFTAMDRAAGRLSRRVGRELDRLSDFRTSRETIRLVAREWVMPCGELTIHRCFL